MQTRHQFCDSGRPELGMFNTRVSSATAVGQHGKTSTNHLQLHSHTSTTLYIHIFLDSTKHLNTKQKFQSTTTANLQQLFVSRVKQWNQELFDSFLNQTQINT